MQGMGLSVFYLNITYPGSLSKPETQVDDFLVIYKMVD